MDETVLRTGGGAETEALGAMLGAALLPGDRIWLRGPLGAGKTTLVRGVVRGLDHPETRDVSSPTFAIHHRYEGGRIPVDHLDLYRLDDGAAAIRQGVLDPLDRRDSIVIVEWPERLPVGLPPPEIDVGLDPAGADQRRIRLRFAAVSRMRFLPVIRAWERRVPDPPGGAGP